MHDMIHIQVKLFGPAADAVGADALEYGLTPPATLGGLLELLYARHPGLAARRASLRFAVNEEYADENTSLGEGDEVAVIPPVAGGDHPSVALTRDPIDVAAIKNRVHDSACGAVLVFEGVVRAEESHGRPLIALEYTAYESMALKRLADLHRETLARFAVHRAALAHRLGRLGIGETSLVVAISSPHRLDALRACEWIIEVLKRDVPIWKKEIWTDGESTWVEPPAAERP